VSEQQGKTDRRGTVWDWPVGLMVAAVVLLIGAPSAVVLWVALFAFGGIMLLARRGAFSPRR